MPLLYPNRRPYTHETVRQDNDLASAPASAFLHRLPHHCHRLESLARRRPCPCPYPPAYPWGVQQFPVQASPYPSPGPYQYPCRRPYPYPYPRLHRRREDGEGSFPCCPCPTCWFVQRRCAAFGALLMFRLRLLGSWFGLAYHPQVA